ncbi:MAG: CsiV family protein [Halieaceae bacterium]|jgi:hypothetical protein|nr:CsiV family protein [Halieaceae bacterium]
MKRRPERRLASLALLLLAAGAAAQDDGQSPSLPEDALEGWYRIELLVFLRDDEASLGVEQWDALPTLAYLPEPRFLIDPELADRRLGESGAFVSRVDLQGRQQLMLPAPFSPLDVDRPDALIREPYVDEALPTPDGFAPETGPAQDVGGLVADGTPTDGEASADGAPKLPEPIPLVLPYMLVDDGDLELRAEARSLRRRGERVVLHAGWWMRLEEDAREDSIFIGRGIDLDQKDWPELQGSVHVYRSRYLHIDVDLWLNTLASYLPEGWQIDAPPLPPPSLTGASLAGESLDPWAPRGMTPFDAGEPGAAAEAIDALFDGPDALLAGGASAAAGGQIAQADTDQRAPAATIDKQAENESGAEINAAEEKLDAPAYPWRHAIVHRQSRRMRSGEIHYLDHPVIGVVVKVLPASADLPPVATKEDLEFRERHGLPVEYIEADESAATDGLRR